MRAIVFGVIVLSKHYIVSGVDKFNLDHDCLNTQILKSYCQWQGSLSLIRLLLSLRASVSRLCT
jgi:hypothetical protein